MLKEKENVVTDTRYFYGPLNDHISMIKKDIIKTLIIMGPCGTGKTTLVNYLVPDAVRIGGHITSAKLYEALYNASDNKIIFFDDTEDLLSNDVSLTLLKQALDTNKQRVVMWDSSTKRDAPPSFLFNSRVIFCMNKIPDDEGMKAIISRCHKCAVEFSYKELLILMYEIAKKQKVLNGTVISAEERKSVVDFIKDNSDITTEDFDLRLQNKVEEYYIYNKLKWKKLALGLLNIKNEKLRIFKEIEEMDISVEQKIQLWSERARLGKSSYYNYRKIYEKRSKNPMF